MKQGPTKMFLILIFFILKTTDHIYPIDDQCNGGCKVVFTPHQTFYPLKKNLQHRLIGPIKLLKFHQNIKFGRPWMCQKT